MLTPAEGEWTESSTPRLSNLNAVHLPKAHPQGSFAGLGASSVTHSEVTTFHSFMSEMASHQDFFM